MKTIYCINQNTNMAYKDIKLAINLLEKLYLSSSISGWSSDTDTDCERCYVDIDKFIVFRQRVIENGQHGRRYSLTALQCHIHTAVTDLHCTLLNNQAIQSVHGFYWVSLNLHPSIHPSLPPLSLIHI